jgi:nucleotide-binding universal stress UspA family protein
MVRRVLVPYDSSEQSKHALSHAVQRFESAEILLIHVVKPLDDNTGVAEHDSGYEQQLETAERMLEGAMQWHDETERERIEPVVRYGRPVHEVLGCIEDSGIDHVVAGSRGRDGAERLLLGSVAETVVRRSPVPVTVVREAPDESSAEAVLVPFDASTRAREALETAFERFPDAEVTALYVSSPPTGGIDSAEAIFNVLSDWDENRDDRVSSVLEVAEEIAAAHNRAVTTESVEGDPAEAIVEYANASGVDHVVVGSTGRDGIARLLLGSVAETVVRRSPVSVTIAK